MQAASDDEETQKQGIVFIFMLALRAVLGESRSCSTATCTSTSAKAVTAAASTMSCAKNANHPSFSLLASSTTLSSSSSSSSSGEGTAATLTPKIETDNHNIFANHSDSDHQPEEKQHLKKEQHQQQDQLEFSPHERSHRHNHTLSRVRVLSKVFRCGPVRVAAIHVCSPNRTELYHIKSDLFEAFYPLERVRTRFHNGTSMECSLSLNKVGIPTDRLPLKYDGTIKTEDHLQWIAIQEAKELAAKQNRSFKIVECPMNMDILSGKFVLGNLIAVSFDSSDDLPDYLLPVTMERTKRAIKQPTARLNHTTLHHSHKF